MDSTAEIIPAGPLGTIQHRSATATRASLAGDWLLAQERPNTVQAYRADIGQFFAWADEFGIDVLTARRRELDGYRRFLKDGSAGRDYTDSSIARKLCSVSSFYRYCTQVEDEDVVPGNPAERVRRPKVSQHSVTAGLDLDELHLLLAVADSDGPSAAAMVRVMTYTGIRVSELCGARTSDLRTERGQLTLGIVRKGGARDRVVIPPEAATVLTSYLGRRTGYLFTAKNGVSPMTRQVVAHHIERLAAAAGIDKKISPHSLRHTCATLARQAGADLRDIQRQLGHDKIETTMRYERSVVNIDHAPALALARMVETGAVSARKPGNGDTERPQADVEPLNF